MDAQHKQRIKAELRAAGASSYGLMKFASRYLPNVIHHDEHIMAAVYGRRKNSTGLLNFSSGMLVATEKRAIYLDHKPGFTTVDEISYDVVSGVRKDSNGLATTVTLHSRIGDYTIRFANIRGADKFVRYIDTQHIEASAANRAAGTYQSGTTAPAAKPLNGKALKFLKQQNIGVLSTVDRTGKVHGAVLYYYVNDKNNICILTKSATQKARDMFVNNQVALTVYDASSAQTVQLTGQATVVADPATRQQIFEQLITPRAYANGVQMPPVTTIHEEGYVALIITPIDAKYTDFLAKA